MTPIPSYRSRQPESEDGVRRVRPCRRAVNVACRSTCLGINCAGGLTVPGEGHRGMLSRRQLLTAAVALGSASAVTGACSRPKAKPGLPRAIDEVTYVTALGLSGREGFAHVADRKGFFREVGITVNITPGAAGDYNLKLVTANKAQFAAIDYSGALIRVGTGAFRPFRCAAALN